jgi:hypothetical protein
MKWKQDIIRINLNYLLTVAEQKIRRIAEQKESVPKVERMEEERNSGEKEDKMKGNDILNCLIICM